VNRAARGTRRGVAGRMRLFIGGLLALLTWCGTSARADDAKGITIGGCKFSSLGTGVVSAVIDARAVVLDGAREVRLAAIEIAAAPRDEPARQTLDGLIGQTVVLRGTAPAAADRYGRIQAHLFVGAAPAERWLQSELIERGDARVAARAGDRACAGELFGRERKARDAKLGLWAEPVYAIRSAEDPAAIAAERGRFAIVEGKVLTVRESGGTIYVNFGKRWTQDFTVTVLKRNERSFAGAGVEPKRLEGLRVRVRGYVEERGGPWIEAVRPEQIEIVGRN
jgi:endonuclease YncB( thermonuclease family)